MALPHTQALTPALITNINALARAYGPVSLLESQKLAAYVSVQPKTARAWFQVAGREGVLRQSYKQARVSTQRDGYQRRRMLLAIGLAYGLERVALYLGRQYTERYIANNLAEASKLLGQIIDGRFDIAPGFRLSKAWTLLEVIANDGEDESSAPWRVVVHYNGFGSRDATDTNYQPGSDPYEDDEPEEGEVDA